MSYKLVSVLLVVNEDNRIVNSSGHPVSDTALPLSTPEGLHGTQVLKTYDVPADARSNLNHIYYVLREMGNMMQDKPARS
jgi:hypothetical protein